MRWYWIDRFVEFESGRYAKAVKCVSLAEDYLHDHFPNHPIFPNSLVVEGLAQTGGLLVCEYSGFTEKVVLAKIPKVEFFADALPGDTLLYTATIEYLKEEGASVIATAHKDGVLFARADIVFVHLRTPSVASFFEPETFFQMMNLLGAFEVGHAAGGGPLLPPPNLFCRATRACSPAEPARQKGPQP